MKPEKFPFKVQMIGLCNSGRRSRKRGATGSAVRESKDHRCYWVVWKGSKTPAPYRKELLRKTSL